MCVQSCRGKKDMGKESKDSGGRSQGSWNIGWKLSGILNQSLMFSEKKGSEGGGQRNGIHSAPTVGQLL